MLATSRLYNDLTNQIKALNAENKQLHNKNMSPKSVILEARSLSLSLSQTPQQPPTVLSATIVPQPSPSLKHPNKKKTKMPTLAAKFPFLMSKFEVTQLVTYLIRECSGEEGISGQSYTFDMVSQITDCLCKIDKYTTFSKHHLMMVFVSNLRMYGFKYEFDYTVPFITTLMIKHRSFDTLDTKTVILTPCGPSTIESRILSRECTYGNCTSHTNPDRMFCDFHHTIPFKKCYAEFCIKPIMNGGMTCLCKTHYHSNGGADFSVLTFMFNEVYDLNIKQQEKTSTAEYQQPPPPPRLTNKRNIEPLYEKEKKPKYT